MKIHILKPSVAEYRITPQVVITGKTTRFEACGLGIETKLTAGEKYIMRIIPLEQIGTMRTLTVGDVGCYDEIECVADENGYIYFSYLFEREQVYTLRLLDATADNRINDFKIFAAKEDLWKRTPMRGNTHCHACPSGDGHEDPVVAASVYRKAGFDYLAITDHHSADGSLHAIKHMKNIPTEMSLYVGEEVHVPNPYIHAVNVGALLEGDIGLDKYYRLHKDEVDAQVAKIAEEVKEILPAGLEPFDYAWRQWIADTIHSKGGIAIVAHPFWEYDAHNTSNDMLRYIAETKLFDAVEIIHGQQGDPTSTDANQQVAFWHDLRAEGINISLVGCDDAHRRNFLYRYQIIHRLKVSQSPLKTDIR